MIELVSVDTNPDPAPRLNQGRLTSQMWLRAHRRTWAIQGAGAHPGALVHHLLGAHGLQVWATDGEPLTATEVTFEEHMAAPWDAAIATPPEPPTAHAHQLATHISWALDMAEDGTPSDMRDPRFNLWQVVQAHLKDTHDACRVLSGEMSPKDPDWDIMPSDVQEAAATLYPAPPPRPPPAGPRPAHRPARR